MERVSGGTEQDEVLLICNELALDEVLVGRVGEVKEWACGEAAAVELDETVVGSRGIRWDGVVEDIVGRESGMDEGMGSDCMWEGVGHVDVLAAGSF